MTIPRYQPTSLPEPRCRRCRRMAGFAIGSVLLSLVAWVPVWSGLRAPPTKPTHVRTEACPPNCRECYRSAQGPIPQPGGSVGIRA